MRIVVSACLLGENCKYNGTNNANRTIIEYVKNHEVIPLCPEIMGGLPVPREPGEIVDGVVRSANGRSMDKQYRTGAECALEIAKKQKADFAILMSRSPSCGVNQIYDGTFSGTMISGKGVFARMLDEEGIEVIDSEDIYETRRIIMRPWCSADAQELYRYAKNPNVGPAAGWAVHGSVEDSLLVIRDILSSPETYAIILKKTGLPIGNIDLMTAERSKLVTNQNECELGFWIGEPYWGQGLVKEAAKELLRHAFEDLKMQTVWCGYYEGNERSMRLQRSLGFVYHSTRENEPVPMLGEVRTEIVNVMQASVYRQKSEHSAG